MSAPPFKVRFSVRSVKTIGALKKKNGPKHTKVQKTLQLLRDAGPQYPALNSHKFSTSVGPDGAEVWESYVENHTPGAWRIWWCYGPGEDTLTIIDVGPHPTS